MRVIHVTMTDGTIEELRGPTAVRSDFGVLAARWPGREQVCIPIHNIRMWTVTEDGE